MLGQQFYHETMRNIIVAFGTLFNNIHLVRKNNSGVVTQTMKVPLAYGPKQKWLTRLDADADLASHRKLGEHAQTWQAAVDLASQRELGGAPQTCRAGAHVASQCEVGESARS